MDQSAWATKSNALFWKFKECGTYKGYGKLLLNKQHQFILALDPGTRQHREVLLLTAKAKNVSEYINKDVEVEMKVYKIKANDESNKSILEKIKIDKKKNRKSEVKLVKNMACR